MAERHLGALIAHAVAEHPDRPAVRHLTDGVWDTLTYRGFGRRIDTIAAALIDLGVVHGDRVAIFSRNRPAWSVVDIATLSIGAVVVPIYQTSTAPQARHILADSQARVVFVEGATELAKIDEIRDQLPHLEYVITFDEVEGAAAYAELTQHQPTDPDALARARANVSVDDLATIIYTSGTTGDPKGVMISHRAFVAEIDAVTQFFHIDHHDSSLAFLPLAHALERAWTFCVLSSGALNTYQADARTVADVLPMARPTLLVSVPRLYEKVYAVAHERGSSTKLKKRIFDWAIATGHRAQAAGRRRPPALELRLRIADRLVLRGIRHAIGGPKKTLAAGGAPLRKEVEEFFHAAGILVVQGYGLTEAAPLISFNAPEAFKFGSVGRVMPGGEIRIGDEGEILYRGPNVMMGYANNPEATAETITADGWLRTGDVGEIDADGFLTITDRLKDLIVTAGGKNIAPGPIEGELAADPLIEYAVVLGDNRPCLTALIRPSLPDLEQLANQLQIQFADVRELLDHERIREELHARVARVSERLPHQEKIRAIEILFDDLTMENGLLTPTLKVKRRAVEKKFHQIVDAMYDKIKNRAR